MDAKLIEQGQKEPHRARVVGHSEANRVRCSFCAKPHGTVRIVAGPGVFICDECVTRCARIFAKRNTDD
jgi:hypothetical protein